nr:protein ATAF2-like [Quercus suber]
MHYLIQKILNRDLPAPNLITEVELSVHSPESLTENHGHDGENVWYFFTQTKRKHTKGKSKYTNQEAFDGYWEVSGAEKKIMKPKTKLQLGIRSNLFSMSMKEKAVDQMDKWTLCRIYHKGKSSETQT